MQIACQEPRRTQQLDDESSRIRTPKNSFEPQGGPVCLVMEQTDGPIR
jgi:hypothetical protein